MESGTPEPVSAWPVGAARAAGPSGPRGAALVVVLWALVALGALALAAAVAARLETALAANYRDHAAALALAEAGLAAALALEAIDPGSASAPRETEGRLETGRWSARWTPGPGRFAVRAVGQGGRAERTIEAWIERADGGAPAVVAWREVH